MLAESILCQKNYFDGLQYVPQILPQNEVLDNTIFVFQIKHIYQKYKSVGRQLLTLYQLL